MVENEVLDGLQEIKNFIDPKQQMSWSYFKKRILPGLKDAVLIKKDFASLHECKYFCFKTQLIVWIHKRKKI